MAEAPNYGILYRDKLVITPQYWLMVGIHTPAFLLHRSFRSQLLMEREGLILQELVSKASANSHDSSFNSSLTWCLLDPLEQPEFQAKKFHRHSILPNQSIFACKISLPVTSSTIVVLLSSTDGATPYPWKKGRDCLCLALFALSPLKSHLINCSHFFTPQSLTETTASAAQSLSHYIFLFSASPVATNMKQWSSFPFRTGLLQQRFSCYGLEDQFRQKLMQMSV